MKIALQLEQVDLSLLKGIWQELIQFIPKMLAAIIVFIVGWLLIKIITYLAKKALVFTKIDTWTDKLEEIEFLKNSNYNFKPTKFIVKALKWVLILIMTIIIADILGLQIVSQEIGNIIRYLPKLFSAIVILVFGIYVANIIRKAVISLFKSIDLGGSKIIGNITFYGITVIVILTSLNQAGINTDIITNNLTIILGSFLLAFTIAFGLGSKEIVQRLLYGFYSRKNLTVGQKIKVGEIIGFIDSIDSIYLVLINDDGRFVFPIKEINDSIVQVFEKE